ncbi:MAG: glycine--tRNA ligase subunit beta [Rhodospirillales bacterium]|nr:glycine--tRNA ligase subunit beta [Rhodospirillales bacterium]
MAAFFLELFSEEIPARMQARGAEDLERLVAEALAPLAPRAARRFYGPRRIALALELAESVAETRIEERGPRLNAPAAALEGFLRKHAAAREDVREQDGYWLLSRTRPAQPAAALIAAVLPGLIRRFPWPKSMRWGSASPFTWVRPLTRITCLLDGAVVPFTLAEDGDDAHGLAADHRSEGHRFHAPGWFIVDNADSWQAELRNRFVLADPAERRAAIAEGLARVAGAAGLRVVADDGLLDEVTGLVEWPVVLLGRIDAAYMDLPPEVMQVSMRVNQRYFALRTADGAAAPAFAFAANIDAPDGGAQIIAGNERVLRARFADARHFWDLDRTIRLVRRNEALENVVFHAKLGTQGQRVRRLVAACAGIGPAVGADAHLASQAALLSKADLATGMVGEFPELQGVMGRYYALHFGQPAAVADAIRDHYAPRGPSDAVPSAPVSIALALADKLDQLVGFFAIGEKPGGSGDPYALRRAGLGVIRILTENGLGAGLRGLIAQASEQYPSSIVSDAARPALVEEVFTFLIERLRVQLRAQGKRHDILAAVFAAGTDDALPHLLARMTALEAVLATPEGADLLAGARRAMNILRIESRKDGPFEGAPDAALFAEPAEHALAAAAEAAAARIGPACAADDHATAMTALASLRGPLDAFFADVTVNAPDPALRRNRLQLLARVRAIMDGVADFSQIEA